jgi:hypothetical protein
MQKRRQHNPAVDNKLVGFWFKLTGEDRIAIDVDGYFWGVQIEQNGNVTVARLDYNNATLTTEATGPAFKLTKTDGGDFTGTSDGETFTGTYQFGTVSNAGYDYNSVYLYSSAINEYLPGGTGGDWSVMGKYIKLYNIDYSDASIGETYSISTTTSLSD